jgi:hypothetical protein
MAKHLILISLETLILIKEANLKIHIIPLTLSHLQDIAHLMDNQNSRIPILIFSKLHKMLAQPTHSQLILLTAGNLIFNLDTMVLLLLTDD